MTTERTLLLVDDDADVRQSLAEVLEEEGYQVLVAANGREALRMLEAHHARPDLILLDIMMPELDGWSFRAEQRKIEDIADIPVVLVTASSALGDRAATLEAELLLRKPLRLQELLDALEIVLK